MTSPTTVTIHLGKARFREARDACRLMSQDVLRLKNQTMWVCRLANDFHDKKTKPLVARVGGGAEKALSEFEKKLASDSGLLKKCIREFNVGREQRARQALPSATGFFGLTPVFLKWMFASSCKSFKDKGHFKALPSRVAQNAVQEAADSFSSFWKALAAWKKDPSKFTGRPNPPSFLADRDVPSFAINAGGLTFDRRMVDAPGKGRDKGSLVSKEIVDICFGAKNPGPKRVKRTGRVVLKEEHDGVGSSNESLRSAVRMDLPGITLPGHVEGLSLRKVSFVPTGVCLKTGAKTKFGKDVFAATSWKMLLVFDTESGADKDGTANRSKGEKVLAKKQARKEACARERSEREERDRVRLEELMIKAKAGTLRCAGLDPGSKNMVTLAANFPTRPLAIKSSAFSGLNQWVSKEWARLSGEENKGRDPTRDHGFAMTEEFGRLLSDKERKFDKWADLVACRVHSWLVENEVECLFAGDGCGAKRNAGSMRSKAARQRFVQLPLVRVIDRIRRKCESSGILVFDVSEAFTSAASFLDNDPLPLLSSGKSADRLRADGVFKAKRKGARLFREGGAQIHSDVNGALNIMSRGVGDAFGIKIDGKALFLSMTRAQRHEFARPESRRVCELFPRRGNGCGDGVSMVSKVSKKENTRKESKMQPNAGKACVFPSEAVSNCFGNQGGSYV